MGQLLGQGERFVAPPQGLVRITEQPQGLRRVGQAPHPRVDPRAEGQGAVLLRVVEGDTLLQVGASRDDLAKPEQARPERKMGFEEERRVVDPLGQAEALLRQFPRRLILRAHQIKPPQPKQDREELRGLPHLPAQLPGSGIGLPDFRGRLALDRHQGRAQGGLQDSVRAGCAQQCPAGLRVPRAPW